MIYTPLEPRCIRLLVFNRKSSIRGDLHFSIRVVNIDKPLPEYTAVSYTWGRSMPTEVIHVDGEPFIIRRNLANCLKTLVYPAGRNRPWQNLWADAICINQNDEQEKIERQIPLMGFIYARATTVSVWLESTYVDECITETTAQNVTTSNHQNSAPHQKSQVPNQHPAWSPYWQRVWIAQEFLLASRIDLYGPDRQLLHHDTGLTAASRFSRKFENKHRSWKIRWPFDRQETFECAHTEILSWVTEDVPKSENMPFVAGIAGMAALSPVQMLLISRYDTGADLEQLMVILLSLADSRCTDPRDRIFGIMSLLSDHEFALLSRVLSISAIPEMLVVVIVLAHLAFTKQCNREKLYRWTKSCPKRLLALQHLDSLLPTYSNTASAGSEISAKLPWKAFHENSGKNMVSMDDMLEWLFDCQRKE